MLNFNIFSNEKNAVLIVHGREKVHHLDPVIYLF